jgi:hypothetical protein
VVINSGFQAEDASALLQMPNVVGFLDKPRTMTSLEMLLASVALPGIRHPNAIRQTKASGRACVSRSSA